MSQRTFPIIHFSLSGNLKSTSSPTSNWPIVLRFESHAPTLRSTPSADTGVSETVRGFRVDFRFARCRKVNPNESKPRAFHVERPATSTSVSVWFHVLGLSTFCLLRFLYRSCRSCLFGTYVARYLEGNVQREKVNIK